MVAPPISLGGRAIKIRLSRGGTKKRPEFFINVAESYRRRDRKFIENLGKFEPIADPSDSCKRIYLNFDRVKYWLSRGARPTFRVSWLLGKANIIPSMPRGLNALKHNQQMLSPTPDIIPNNSAHPENLLAENESNKL